MKRIAFFLMSFTFCFITVVWSQESKLSKKELVAQKITEQLNNRKFKIMVQWAYPMRGTSISLNSLYSLEIKGDTVVSYLPYYGQATTIPYGGGKALNFEARITDYQVVFSKKNYARVTFSARNEEDTYQFSINVFTNGNTSIIITPIHRDAISFGGEAVVDLEKPSSINAQH